MIAIISDLHLQHTGKDGIRHRESDGSLRVTEVVRNVGGAALDLLMSEIASNVRSTRASRVELVLAGDIFELHRTPLWHLGGGVLRPVMDDQEALEPMTLEILSAIERECGDFFGALRAFAQRGVEGAPHADGRSVPVLVHYLPGNHDRLANATPNVRARVRQMLGMAPSSAPFPHVLDWPRVGEVGYGVRVRHGHEYDEQNFPVPFDAESDDPTPYDRPVLGDFATVDVATRTALAFRARYARELRAPGEEGDPYRRLYTAITEFDDVRPAASLISYVDAFAHQGPEGTFSILKPVLLDAFEYARHDEFFLGEAKRLHLAQYFTGLLGGIVDVALNSFPPKLMADIIDAANRLQATSKPPAFYAAKEPGLDSGAIDLVVAGHTHQPDHVGLRGTGGAYFLDSGTWRTRIDEGQGRAFGRLRSYTMIFCYDETEVKAASAGLANGERRRFEAWTGHLRGDSYGPEIARLARPEEVSPVRTTQRVTFVSCTPSFDGDLALTLGVDGEAVTVELPRVAAGEERPLVDASVEADPSLDGEVWCVGVKKDGGAFFRHPLALPWAVDFLPRASPVAAFDEGVRTMLARDNQGRQYRIKFRVV